MGGAPLFWLVYGMLVSGGGGHGHAVLSFLAREASLSWRVCCLLQTPKWDLGCWGARVGADCWVGVGPLTTSLVLTTFPSRAYILGMLIYQNADTPFMWSTLMF